LTLILGIDPGSRITGYGLVSVSGKRIEYVDSGVIRLNTRAPLHERLRALKKRLDEIIAERNPGALALEDIFLSKNPRSTMILGEVRGVVLLAAAESEMEIFEYSAREVKGSVVGSGAAHKSQVSGMIRKILKLAHEPETEDETDALAVAFCHALRISGFNLG